MSEEQAPVTALTRSQISATLSGPEASPRTRRMASRTCPGGRRFIASSMERC